DARTRPVRPAREAGDTEHVEQVVPGALPARPWIDQPCGEALEVVHADAAQHGDEGIAGDDRATGHEVRAWFGVGHVYFKPQSRQLAAIDRLAGHDAALRQFRPGGDAVVMEVALGHYVIAGHGPALGNGRTPILSLPSLLRTRRLPGPSSIPHNHHPRHHGRVRSWCRFQGRPHVAWARCDASRPPSDNAWRQTM